MFSKLRLLIKRLALGSKLRCPIRRAWNTYEHVVFEYNIWKNSRDISVTAKIDAYNLFWVSPADINVASGESFNFLTDSGQIVGGCWDHDHSNITDSSHYELFEQRFDEGRAWHETDGYDRRIEKIQSGKNRRYASINEVVSKFEKYDKMYNEFLQDNYLTQQELIRKDSDGVPGDGGRALLPSITDHTLMRHEVAINIGRDGTLLRNEGRHRICLAALAEVEKIPVRVVVRHTEWQNLRDSIARTIDDALETGVPTETVRNHVQDTLADEINGVHNGLDHPDLDIIFERRLPTD